MPKKKDEEILSGYAAAEEASRKQQEKVQEPQPAQQAQPTGPQMSDRYPDGTLLPQSVRDLRRDAGMINEQANFTAEPRYANNIGYFKIPVETLPSQGKHYPEDITINIRAAWGEEIKHWSTMNEEDLTELSRTDDILNYIIERCVGVRSISNPALSWKDLKEVDRTYILIAVHDLTFPNNENTLMVPISEGKEIPLQKEMIDFIEFPEELERFYSAEERCFKFDLRKANKTIRLYIPSIGANAWIKTYVQTKANAREQFDQDFAMYAPMLIGDFRKLSQRMYEEMVSEARTWGVDEWSLITYVAKLLKDSSTPKFKYIDESGQEVQIPLTFRGGFKALFTIPDPLSKLC